MYIILSIKYFSSNDKTENVLGGAKQEFGFSSLDETKLSFYLHRFHLLETIQEASIQAANTNLFQDRQSVSRKEQKQIRDKNKSIFR